MTNTTALVRASDKRLREVMPRMKVWKENNVISGIVSSREQRLTLAVTGNTQSFQLGLLESDKSERRLQLQTLIHTSVSHGCGALLHNLPEHASSHPQPYHEETLSMMVKGLHFNEPTLIVKSQESIFDSVWLSADERTKLH